MNQQLPSPPSKLAITIDYAALRSLMLAYIAEQTRDDANEPYLTMELERQLTLSGFLVWLRNQQREQQ